MRDPNHIALQSTDPDLHEDIDAIGENGAGDLMDYAGTVGTWGEETTEYLADQVGTLSPTVARPRPIFPQTGDSYFHPRHQMRAPFVVAAIVTVVILAIVFIPS